jgi:hypothetical protein
MAMTVCPIGPALQVMNTRGWRRRDDRLLSSRCSRDDQSRSHPSAIAEVWKATP